jgi:hypothetical protein
MCSKTTCPDRDLAALATTLRQTVRMRNNSLLFWLPELGIHLALGASRRCVVVDDAPHHHPCPHNIQEGLGLLCISLNLASQKLQSLQPPLLPVDKGGMVDMLA